MFSKFAAHVKSYMPVCLLIGAILWGIYAVTEGGSGINVISAVFGIAMTSVTIYVVVSIGILVFKFLWSLFKRIPRGNMTSILVFAIVSMLLVNSVAVANPKNKAVERVIYFVSGALGGGALWDGYKATMKWASKQADKVYEVVGKTAKTTAKVYKSWVTTPPPGLPRSP